MYLVTKKNKRIEVFDRSKITKAIEAAIGSPKDIEKTSAAVFDLVQFVTQEVCQPGRKVIPIEEIHNTVEEYLKKHYDPSSIVKLSNVWDGLLDRYIKFKEKKAREFVESIESLEGYLGDQFNTYPGVDIKLVIDSLDQKMPSFDDMGAIHKLLIRLINNNAKNHSDYSYLAGEILYTEIEREVQENLGSLDFDTYYNRCVELGLVEKQITDLEKVDGFIAKKGGKSKLKYRKYTYLSLLTLYDRYLLRDGNKVIETPQWLWFRTASILNNKEDRLKVYQAISNFDFMPSTPTLFNASTRHPQLSSCYVTTCPDSLDGIFKTQADIAQLSKWAGGIGVDYTSIRGQGSKIHGTNGQSGGLIPYINIMNAIAIAVNQGGKRKGAVAVYIENWHIDVEEFIDLRKNTGDERRRAHDIHPVLYVSDLFMKRVEEGGDWTLFCPTVAPCLRISYGKDFENEYVKYENTIPLGQKKSIKARLLWKRMLTSLYETGHPWITWKCAINVRNPQKHVGMIHSSNLCTEITLNTSGGQTAVCNLGSINLAQHVTKKTLDVEKLKKTISIAVTFLNAVIDKNFYPTQEARQSNLAYRPIGLGIMGLQDMLWKMELDFDSQEALEISSAVMEYISYYSIECSSDLAKQHGSYVNFRDSLWDQGIFPIDTVKHLAKDRGQDIKIWESTRLLYDLNWGALKQKVKAQGLRNSNLIAIAPTATIANIVGVIPTHEPVFGNIYTKNNLSGTFFIINRHLVEFFEKYSSNGWSVEIADHLLEHNGSIQNYNGDDFSKEDLKKLKGLFRTVWEIDPYKLLNSVAARTQWVDQSASTNLFIKTKSGKEISNTYLYAWKLGLKTTYYLRSLNTNEISKVSNVKSCTTNAVDCDACE